MLKNLLVTIPWLSARVPIPPVSFRPVDWFADLAAAYARLNEEKKRSALGGDPSLWIPKDQECMNNYLTSY